MELLHELLNWVLGWAHSPYGAVALFLIATAESIFFPVPPDPLLIALGVGKPTSAPLFAAVTLAGSLLGATIGYGLGLYGGRPVVYRLFAEEKVRFVEERYQRWDVWAILIAALTPIPYKVFTVTAGMFRLRFGRFLLASLIGRGGRFFAVGTLIALFGESIATFIDEYFDFLVVAFVVLLLGGFAVIRFFMRPRQRVAEPAEEVPLPE